MLNIFFWLIFGMLSGWTVALVSEPQAVPRRVNGSGLLGMIGGLVGGGLAQLVAGHPFVDGFNGGSMVAAVIVAAVFASAFNVLAHHQHT